MRLECSGTWLATAHMVSIDIYFASDDGEIFNPELIDSGFTELRTTAGQVLARQEFNKYAGTERGCINVFFLNPAVYDSQWPGLKAYTEVQSGEDIYREEVAVQIDRSPHIPLEENDAGEIHDHDDGGIQTDTRDQTVIYDVED